MLLKRFYDNRLAQASYLVGCPATGEAVVIDPNRDADQYLETAAAEGLRVTHVTETHIHADYVSGSRELAARSGARLLLSAEGGPDWQYAFAGQDGATLLHDGDTFMVGNLQFQALHTPGHTPEHLTFIVTDTPATSRPMGAFTGDFIFVGDVGRPDLLERAAHVANTMRASARQLFRSLQRFRELPDYLQIWPGHGAGSACGKALGAVPSSTLGYERMVNWAFGLEHEDAFVDAVLAGQPEPPAYFARMKVVNREGPAVMGGWPTPPVLPAGELAPVLERGGLVIDLRPAPAHAAGHIPGTLNLPFDRSFTTWAGSLLPYDRDLYLLGAAAPHLADEAVHALTMIGFDRVAGIFPSDAVDLWAGQASLETVPQVDPAATLLGDPGLVILDVRGRSEWDAGHVPDAEHVPLGELAGHLDTLPSDRTILLQCQSGARSSIAASLLQTRGVKNLANLQGGFAAWREAGLPVEHDGAKVAS